MGSELRFEALVGNVADATTQSNSVSEFRNDSSRTLHIRDIRWTHIYATHEAEESGLIEISKSPTVASLVNNGVFFSLPVRCGGLGATTGAAVDDQSSPTNGGWKYGRGQLTLEPNESLFVNCIKSSGGIMSYDWIIGYHY